MLARALKAVGVSLALLVLIAVASCRTPSTDSESGASLKAAAEATPTAVSFYTGKIQPLFDTKCVACHACNQSPCQVNLTSYEGVRRGAQAVNIYAKRLSRVDPVRLYVDGATEDDWRAKGFWPVVGAAGSASILWEMLELKAEFPHEKLAYSAEDALLKPGMCQSLDKDHHGDLASFRKFYRSSSLLGNSRRAYGMPYGFAALTDSELADIRSWLDQGASGPSQAEADAAATPRADATKDAVTRWEAFLNGPSPKEKLVARYIYEHLYNGHLYFGDDHGGFQVGAEREFYRIVRTKDQTGTVQSEVGTRHPYDAPGLANFSYRLRKMTETLVHKSHITFQINDRKLNRFKELFLNDTWNTTTLPPYGAPGSNPIQTYAAIPVWARYQFMLDDAMFYTMNDIRGPVCSGALAISVIQDLGWRVYLKPDSDPTVTDEGFFAAKDDAGHAVTDLLNMPAETQESSLQTAQAALLSGFLKDEKSYIRTRDKSYAAHLPRVGIADLWDGNGNAIHGLKYGESAYPGALQTIVRSFDSGDVVTGLIGNMPKTVELFDYPLLERTYYNLVPGFDVYGSIISGLNIRAYKDAIRLESEDNFLKLVPSQNRQAVRDFWYSGKTAAGREAVRAWMKLWNPLVPSPSADRETTDSYPELSSQSQGQLAAETVMHRIAAHFAESGLQKKAPTANADLLPQFASLTNGGNFAQYMPEISFIRVGDGLDDDAALSIIMNRFRTNTKFLFADTITDLPELDRLMVTEEPMGSFPNMIFHMTRAQVPQFVAALANVKSQKDYESLRQTYGLSRDEPAIWTQADWFYQQALRRHPVNAARYDLLRYELFYR